VRRCYPATFQHNKSIVSNFVIAIPHDDGKVPVITVICDNDKVRNAVNAAYDSGNVPVHSTSLKPHASVSNFVANAKDEGNEG
jgi:hypothetical protein